MGLKPDHWIRKMALEHRMIEPFVESQVRNGVISYGVSSYGYDIRVADEFKIFTNVYSAVVDPKNFDPKSMVDFKGEVCVIPPNSFALARTVEYFRIPRKVLTVCLGKCLTGDTRVVDAATGDYLPLEQFVAAKRSATVALNEKWRLNAAAVSAHFNQGIKPVFLLTTRLGLKIKATANHPFRTFQGWTNLADLRAGDRIAVARSIPIFGKTEWAEHEATLLGLMLSDGQCYTPGHSPRFTNDDPAIVDALYDAAGKFGVEVSPVGKFGYNLVNRKGRGGAVTRNRLYSWLESLGCNVGSADKFIPPIVFTAARASVREFVRALFSGDGSIYTSERGVFLEYSSISERLILDLRHLLLRFGIFGLVRNKISAGGKQAYRLQITDPEMVGRFAQEIGFIHGSRKQILLEKLTRMPLDRSRSNFDTLPSSAWSMMRQAVTAADKSLRSIGITATQPAQSLPYSTARIAAEAAADHEFASLVESDVIWDTVKSIEPAGEEMVYDISAPEGGNFLANDIVVHNSTYARCGIIVNVTPFEPCFSSDTEILTPEGWRLIKDVQVGDLVLGMAKDGCAEYQPVMTKQVYDYQGELLRFAGKSIDLLVSPEHKVLVNRRTNGRRNRKGAEKTGWRTAPAKEVFGAHNYEMLREVRWRGETPEDHISINGDSYPTKAFLRFLGLWLGDGSAYVAHKGDKNSGYVVQIAAFNRKREYVQAVLNDLGIRYSAMREGFRFFKKSLYEYLAPLVHAENKHLPREWLRLDAAHISLILEGLMMADGNAETQTITTCSRQLADDIQVMAFLSGRSAIVRQAKQHGGPREWQGRVIKSNFPVYKVRLSEGQMTPQIRPSQHKTEPYAGKIYDVTVPNHLIFVRRNGKAVWSGNCWEGFVTLEISNTTPLPAKIYANEGIAQVLFFEADEECEISYADKKGKYQKQQSIVLPKL